MAKRLMLISTLAAAATALGDETLRRIDWAALASGGELLSGEVSPAGETAPGAYVTIRSATSAGGQFTVLSIANPQVTADLFALHGQVKYDGVEGQAYLEMLAHTPDGSYFSRTVAPDGPLRSLGGSSDWRRFVLPFNLTGGELVRIDLSVVLPGRGNVSLGPVRLAQYGAGENPIAVGSSGPANQGQWWSARHGGLIGGCAGGLLGCLGGLLGWLVSRGKARRAVTWLLWVGVVFGASCLLAGFVALACSQPYHVYYILLLIGFLCTFLGALLLGRARQVYRQAELRRMQALDATR